MQERKYRIDIGYECKGCGAGAYSDGTGSSSRIYIPHMYNCPLAISIISKWPRLALRIGLTNLQRNPSELAVA